MINSKENNKNILRKIQKRLIINETSGQSFYTKFNGNSNNVADIYKLGPEIFYEIFHSKKWCINLPATNIKIQSDIDLSCESAIKKIRKIHTQNDKKVKETGIDQLCIGFPYITGKIISPTSEGIEPFTNYYRAPILLFPVELEFPSSTQVKIKAHAPYLNKSLFLRMAVINKKQLELDNLHLNITDEEIEDISSCKFERIPDMLRKCGCVFNKEEEDSLIKMLSEFSCSNFTQAEKGKKDYFENQISHKSEFHNFATIGIFSNQNASLFQSFEEIISTNSGTEFIEEIMESFSIDLKDKENMKEFREDEILQIGELDYSQKNAVAMAMNSSLVIQGPPGTGKSQTICNIIANCINRGKSVLFAAEKFPAAEVVFNRLGNLKNACLFAFDVHNPAKKKIFYDHIYSTFSKIENFHTQYITNENIGLKIEEIFDKIDEFKLFMNEKQTVEYLRFLAEYTGQLDEIKNNYDKYKILINSVENDKELWEKIINFKNDMNNYYFASDVQKKFELNNDTFSLYIDLCKHFRDEEKFYKYDLPFFIQKNKIKTKYNFFDKFFTIKKIVKKHPFHKTIHNAAQCSTQEIISFFKNYSYKEFSKFRVFSQSDEFAQTLKFSKNEDYNFDLQKYKKYIKYTQFDEKNIHMLSFNLEKAKQQIKELLIQKTQKESKIIEEAFFAALHQKILNNRELNKEFNDLYKHAQGLRMREVKWAMNRFPNILAVAFPIIISSPDTACSLYHMQRKIFDYVIFDEASQITLERSLPIVFLGDKIIIAGDKQQLQPSDFFSARVKEEYEETYKEGEDDLIQNFEDIEDSESLLSFMEKKFHQTMLMYHYRSSKRELIQFSNAVFYDNKLVISDSPKNNVPGIECIDVNGVWSENVNSKEAEKVVELVKKICSKKDHGTIGIITFNAKQQILIEDMLWDADDTNIKNEFERINSKNEDISLFVKNIENVQGDERDIIIFSIAYAKQPDGKFSNSFGPINTKGGKNRINVAISRAKDKIYVIKSICNNLINREVSQNNLDGRKIFGDYLEYVENFSKYKTLDNKEINEIFNRYCKHIDYDSNNKNVSSEHFDSPFEEEVYYALHKHLDGKKYEVVSQAKQSGYSIDLAIRDKKTKNYILAIECDGYLYHTSESQKEADYYRQAFLESKGWIFERIPSREWYRNDKTKIIDNILLKIEKMI